MLANSLILSQLYCCEVWNSNLEELTWIRRRDCDGLISLDVKGLSSPGCKRKMGLTWINFGIGKEKFVFRIFKCFDVERFCAKMHYFDETVFYSRSRCGTHILIYSWRQISF